MAMYASDSTPLPNPYEDDPKWDGVQDDASAIDERFAQIVAVLREDPVGWARRQITDPSQDWHRQCLKFVRTAFGLPPVYSTARLAWVNAKHKHPTQNISDIPDDAPVAVFFNTSGSSDHVVITIPHSNGLCISTDWLREGKPDVARMADIARLWGPLYGWTEDLNGSPIYEPPTALSKFWDVYTEKGKIRVDLLDVVIKAGTHDHIKKIAVVRDGLSQQMNRLKKVNHAKGSRIDKVLRIWKSKKKIRQDLLHDAVAKAGRAGVVKSVLHNNAELIKSLPSR